MKQLALFILVLTIVNAFALNGRAEETAPSLVSSYEYVAPIAAPEGPARLYVLELPASVLGKMRALGADLRLLDGAGKEVPYYLQVIDGKEQVQRVNGVELNRGRKPGEFSEATIKLDTPAQEVNSVDIDTASRNFRYPVTIEGSNDGQDWLLLVDKVSIFDFTEDIRLRKTKVDLPPSSFRYYRVRVFDSEGEPFEFGNFSFSFTTKAPLELVEVNAEVGDWVERSEVRASEADVHLSAGSLPLGAMRIATSTEQFQRSFSLSAPRGEHGWEDVSTGMQFHRIRSPKLESEELTAYLSNAHVPSDFKVVVANLNNPPLKDLELRFFVYRHLLYFPGEWAAPLKLYVGSAGASTLSYEFAELFKYEEQSKAAAVSLEPLVENAQYVAPVVPLPERIAKNPLLLYGAYALAALVVLLLVFRAIRQPQETA